MSKESIKPPFTTDNIFDPEIIHKNGQRKITIKGICLKQDNISFSSWECSKFIYCLKTRCMVKGFNHRFCVK